MRVGVLVALLVAVVAFASVATAEDEYTYVQDMTFAAVKSQPQPRLVVFYFGSDEAAKPVLDTVEKAAEYLTNADLPQLKHFQWAKVDCETEDNKSECDEAGFKAGGGNGGLWIFTSTPNEGIQSFNGARNVATIAAHVRYKYLPNDEEDVIAFTDETALFERMDKSDSDQPKPVFIKMWESWCDHCKKLKLPFEQAAGFFKSQVEFMEVECSKNAQTKAFCQSNAVNSYPTLMLFDGEKKHKYDLPDKSILSFQKFFLSTLPEDRFQPQEDESAKDLPPLEGAEEAAPARPAKQEKSEKKASESGKKKAAAARNDEEDDEPAPKKGGAKKNAKRAQQDDEEDEAPRRRGGKKSRSRRDEEDDEDDYPRRRRNARRRRDEDDEDEDDYPRRKRNNRRRYDEDDEDEAPRKKGKKAPKRAAAEDDEEPAPKKKAGKKARKEEDLHDEL